MAEFIPVDATSAVLEAVDRLKSSGKYQDLVDLLTETSLNFVRASSDDPERGKYTPMMDMATIKFSGDTSAEALLGTLVHELTHTQQVKARTAADRVARKASYTIGEYQLPKGKFLRAIDSADGTYSRSTEVPARLSSMFRTEAVPDEPWGRVINEHRDAAKQMYVDYMMNVLGRSPTPPETLTFLDRLLLTMSGNSRLKNSVQPTVGDAPFTRYEKSKTGKESKK